MFGGLAIAALAVLAAQVLRPDAPAVAAPASVVAASRVLVAVRALPVGHVTAAADFDWRAWPSDGVDAAYIVAG